MPANLLDTPDSGPPQTLQSLRFVMWSVVQTPVGYRLTVHDNWLLVGGLLKNTQKLLRKPSRCAMFIFRDLSKGRKLNGGNCGHG